ncbi:hypothetical protein N5923_03570 [Erwiniaceae bacterium BAC15a-03b]|uniref:Mobilization protein MobC n=1 Tax=Winslowiella arboricola TaxID=2978220 RepID=A0A9J6PPF2_9GAMM|nr:hypothetical protein [Winslowiella arboricola]MCU5773508.1 hypothetical protein [Winslowiella arboricola]MCU5776580.1 hypothetical protein [Winslowiella arboricola]
MNTTFPPFPLEKLRIYCVSVRLNNAELLKLNEERKQFAKGEWLRMCFMKNQPAVIPEINRSAWTIFGEINQRLNGILNHLNAKQSCNPLTNTELFVVKRQISDLRSRLLSTEIWSVPSS